MIGTTSFLGRTFGGLNPPMFTPQTDRAYPEALARQGFRSSPVFIGAESVLTENGQPSGQAAVSVRPFYRPGAEGHVTVLDSSPGAGIFVPTFLADYAQVGVGDTLEIDGATVAVVGVYQNLYDEPVRPFWCSYSALFNNETSADSPLDDLVIATDPEIFYQLAIAHDTASNEGRFFSEPATRMWEVPVDPDTVTSTSASADLVGQNTAFLEASSISGDSTRIGQFPRRRAGPAAQPLQATGELATHNTQSSIATGTSPQR